MAGTVAGTGGIALALGGRIGLVAGIALLTLGLSPLAATPPSPIAPRAVTTGTPAAAVFSAALARAGAIPGTRLAGA